MQLKVSKKQSGILLPLSSLPGNYAVGDFGAQSYRFVRFLKAADQTLWQILPLTVTDEFGSPYKSLSCFAGDPVYISLEALKKQGLIYPEEMPKAIESTKTDYKTARRIKMPLLYKAADRLSRKGFKLKRFLSENAFWLDDYALYCAASNNGAIPLCDFEDDLKIRDFAAIRRLKIEKAEIIERHKIIQFFFFSQYKSLKEYANRHGVKIIGDMPFYVSGDSAEVWSNPNNFCLNTDMSPRLIAGVPPDRFSSTGQLWGNPIYDFRYQKSDGFSWIKKRIRYNLMLYDILRIDHFRAFANYYCIEGEEKTAQNGFLRDGIGTELFSSFRPPLQSSRIIAEDLGGEDDPKVISLIARFGFFDTRVLQFGFYSDAENRFLPDNYKSRCAAYTGTHDNNTVLGWFETEATKKERAFAEKYLPQKELPLPYRMAKALASSAAKIMIVPFADYLLLDKSGRINTPGTLAGNWSFRIEKQNLTEELAKTISTYSKRKEC